MKKINLRITTIIATIMLTLNQGITAYGFSQNNNLINSQVNNNSNITGKNPVSFSKKLERPYVKGQVIIKYKDGTINDKKQLTLGKVKSLGIKHRNEKLNEDVVSLEANESVEDVVNKLSEDSNVEFVQPNYIYTTNDFSSEPLSNYEWGMLNGGQNILSSTGISGVDISLRDAWNITQGDSQVVVGVVDTGIDINHPDLKDRIWINPDVKADENKYPNDINGWDFYNNDNNVFDSADGDDHGTHVAGIIAASLNNIGVAGVAPKVKIMPLKFMGPNGGTTYDAVRAIQYAESKGVKILNLSFGGTDYDPALKDAIDKSGCLVVAAAGNESLNNDVTPSYPASYKLNNIISVAAVDNKGNLASFSNYGPSTVDIAAPGVDILSTVPKSSNIRSYSQAYAYYSGTSMAAPFVTGIAALLYSYGVRDPLIIKQDIIQSSKAISSLKGQIATGGMVDAYRALMAANISVKSENNFNRIAGSDRYATSLQISRAGWNTSDYAVLASGASFPDALSAAPLAKKYNAPILLTAGDILTEELDAELDRLKVKNVFIIGGTGSVSSNIEDKLKQKNISYTRLSGANRYETSVAIANYLGSSTKVFVVNGENFPDALSIASYAASKGIPILITQKNILPLGALNYIRENGVTDTYVIGGTSVVSNFILYQLPNPQRIYGDDRYETNFQVLSTFGNDFSLTYSYFASGENFPDALSGSALAAATNSPIVLIGSNTDVDINTFIRSNLNSMTNKRILGGEGALPLIEISRIFY